jgi:amidohydrolase
MKRIFFLLVFFTYMGVFGQTKDEINSILEKNYPVLDTLYKHLHKYPELSGNEKHISEIVAQNLQSLGFQVTEHIGGYGVVGILQNGNGPIIMIRGDMDALPVEEKTGLPYSSCTKGTNKDGQETFIMHACGHDIHTTILLGTAKTLKEMKKKWNGTLMIVAQPCEEIGMGAKNMIKDGLFQKFPKPDYALALHVNPFLESGTLGCLAGPIFASVDDINITIFGIGGHGAMPESTIDPVVLSARLILDLQTLISREKPAINPAVLTIGSINGGTRHNIIPNEVKIQLTLRTYDDELRSKLIKGIERISKGLAISAGLPEEKYPKIEIQDQSIPSTINDKNLSERVINIYKEYFGSDKVIPASPTMTGEDFGVYGKTKENIPIFLFWLGSITKEKINESIKQKTTLPGLHSSFFAPEPERTIKTGISAFSAAAIKLFKK